MTDFTQPHHSAVQQLTSPGAPFEVTTREVGGFALKCYKNAMPNLRVFLDGGRQFGDAPFVQYPGQAWTFAEFFTAVDALAGFLHSTVGIAKGDRVAIAMRNRPEWLIAFTASISVGAVVVPLNSWGKGEELDQGLGDSNAKLLIGDSQRFNYVRSVNNPLPALLVDGEPGDAPEFTWDEALACTDTAPETAIESDDPAMLLFTSGTSGRPKAASFTHFNCCQALMNVEFIGAATYMTNTDAMNRQLGSGVPPKTLLAVPLFHISGLFSQFAVNIKHGRGLYIMYKWDAAEALRLIREEGITVLMGAPAMMLELLTRPDITPEDLRNIANISAGGAATPDVLHSLYRDKANATLGGAGWGMTETGGTGAAFTGRYMHDRPGSSGFPSPIMEFSFRDEEGHEVDAGAPGELWVRSSAAVQDYFGHGSGNGDFVDGWFKTGDIGYINDEGLLYLCGRAKDMIIRGGENVYPAEIEAILLEYPGCIEAGVVGIPSEHWGEEVAAVVRFDAAEPPSSEALREHCAAHLAGFKVPVKFAFANEPLPRNAVQKLLKVAIRENYFPH